VIDPIGPQKKPGALAPLFHRLIDENPDFTTEASPYGYLTPDEVKLSVFSELERLLNTRCMPNRGSATAYGIAPHFGIENFSPYEGASPSSWPIIADSLQSTIKNFEPRLEDPKVTVASYDPSNQSLSLTVGGTILLNNQKERVCFSMQVGAS
jgi:type VI secretion system lysozyme-like protein